MKKLHDNRGFTLAELMIVVGIIAVLAGISFVGVTRYQKALEQRQMDSYAKELFVAAQNHLTMAKSDGALATVKKSSEIAATDEEKQTILGIQESATKGIYYFVGQYPGTSASSVLDLMLPFGAVEDGIRNDGSYIIRYQLSAAKVLDVFYAQGRFTFTAADYNKLMGPAEGEKTYAGSSKAQRQQRMAYITASGQEAKVGWFGGDMASELPDGQRLADPTVEVVNGVRLVVNVHNPNYAYSGAGARVKLLIEDIPFDSEGSGAVSQMVQIEDLDPSEEDQTIVLDDVTTNGKHYAQTCVGLTPGRNITVKAMAYNNDQLTNVAYSSGVTTNSLFADVKDLGTNITGLTETEPAAIIGNFRHLENLNVFISDYQKTDAVYAAQVADLDWEKFIAEIHDDKEEAPTAQLHIWLKSGGCSDDGCFIPVQPANTPLCYYGVDLLAQNPQMRLISNLKVQYEGPAGVFGALPTSSVLANLTVVKGTITSGTGTGSAGGLVGVMSGNVYNCGADCVVSAGGSAGGLIGSVGAGARVENCYSGGRAPAGKYSTENYNVTSTGADAGGLIGFANNATVSSCYSTCSAKGVNAGGLVGSVGGNGNTSILNCYATGAVKAATTGKAGGLVGTGDKVSFGPLPTPASLYLASIAGGKAHGTVDDPANAGAAEKDLDTLNRILADTPAPAVPVDPTLGSTYPFMTVKQLNSSAPDFMNKHYGDWPALGVSVPNQKNS